MFNLLKFILEAIIAMVKLQQVKHIWDTITGTAEEMEEILSSAADRA